MELLTYSLSRDVMTKPGTARLFFACGWESGNYVMGWRPLARALRRAEGDKLDFRVLNKGLNKRPVLRKLSNRLCNLVLYTF